MARELAHLIDHGWVTVEGDVLLPEELGSLKDLRSKVELTDAGGFLLSNDEKRQHLRQRPASSLKLHVSSP